MKPAETWTREDIEEACRWIPELLDSQARSARERGDLNGALIDIFNIASERRGDGFQEIQTIAARALQYER